MLNQPEETGRRKTIKINDPELARAMTYDQVKDGEESTNSPYVNFDVFFLRDLDGDGVAESVRGACREVGKEDTVYMELNVLTKGYLENAVIKINGENFYLQTAIPRDAEVAANAIGNNTKEIILNQINSGTQKLLTGIVRSGDYSYSTRKAEAIGNDISKYSKKNNITLEGTHVEIGEDGNEIRTKVIKTVEFNVDWHGSIKAEFPKYLITSKQDLVSAIDEENETFTVERDIQINELNNMLILKKAYIEGTAPEIGGYAPKVEITGTNITYTYSEATRKFTAQREAIVDENNVITSPVADGGRSNSFKVKMTYPLNAYTDLGIEELEARIPVSGYYEAFNNENSEFKNPYKSNTVQETLIVKVGNPPKGKVADISIDVGKYISKPKYKWIVSKEKPLRMYNGMSEQEFDDNYLVTWNIRTGTEGKTTALVMKENKNEEVKKVDKFIKTNGTDETNEVMEQIVSNIGIYFSNPTEMLGEEGWIKIYDDETEQLIETFTASTWNKYSANRPYMYEIPLKNIRVETSDTNINSSFTIYNIKSLNDDCILEHYTQEEFEELQYIHSRLSATLTTIEDGGNHEFYIEDEAHYEAPYTLAEISLEKTILSTQETQHNMKFTITTKANEDENQVKWQNGVFLIKLPKSILEVEVNSVEIRNNSKTVEIISYEQFEVNGQQQIKINTENDIPDSFSVVIDAHITPDPRIISIVDTVELYYANESATEYYTKVKDTDDINNNLSTEDIIGRATVSLSLVSPDSLLTNESITNYDDKESIAVAPKTAEITKEQTTATVNIEINNNYSNTISEIAILGRVPYEGNKYTINGNNLNSTFTATMSNTGIILPQQLQGKAIVYYSENGEATRDLTDSNNGWTRTPADFKLVKSYLIDLQEHQLQRGEKHKFSYEIDIPKGLNYNQISYSHHAVYFTLDTVEGKYRTQTEPNKVGIMVTKQYDLELIKYQKGTTNVVPGATYVFIEEGNDQGRTRVTGRDGILKLTGLHIEKEYTVREVKSPEEYELNPNEIKFTTSEENGELVVTPVNNNAKKIETVQAQENEDRKVKIEVEDEVKARLKIIKTEKDTETKLKGVRFKITGEGFSENGKTVTTNVNGEINLKGLKIGAEYTLEEVKADGYYLASPIKIKVLNNEGTYSVETLEGTIKEITIVEENNIPVVNLKIENEKKPTYTLELTKIKKVTPVEEGEGTETKPEEITYLAGAKFKLYKNGKEIGKYETDVNGKLVIENLYQYVEEKASQEAGEYILKETFAPEGYAKVKDIQFKVVKNGETIEFIEELVEGQTAKKYEIEGTTVKVTVEDSPSFRLIKKDAETGELLANTKFAIYNVDNDTIPASNSKGEIIGTKETINGREYYVVTTNSVGEITLDLPEGMYKAVEVEADEKYDISESVYYFGIGASREAKKVYKATWAEGIGGAGDERIKSVVETPDGGYIVGGYFKSNSIDLGKGHVLENKGSIDGMIIKYSSKGEIEWTKEIGGSKDDGINSIVATIDGDYIVVGYFESSSVDLGNGIVLEKKSYYPCGMIIRYSSEGDVKWAKGISGADNSGIISISETKNGDYIVIGTFYEKNIDVGNGIVLNDNSWIIKYNSVGQAIWGKAINSKDWVSLQSVAATKDGGFIIGGMFQESNIDFGNEIILNNQGYLNGMIVKYDNEGNVEWAKGTNGNMRDRIHSVAETEDGGYIVGGTTSSERVDLGKGITIVNPNYITNYAIIIKYDSKGEPEWGKGFGGGDGACVNTVIETADGNYIAVGYFSNSIMLDNKIGLHNAGSECNGIIIKYKRNGDIEWAKSINENVKSNINSVIETKNGEYILGGYFTSESIDIGTIATLNNKGEPDGIIIKYAPVEITENVINQSKAIGGNNNDGINSVEETKDGGYIVGGYFSSVSIDLSKEIILNNRGSNDGMLIKYNIEGQVEWAKVIGGNGSDIINSLALTLDGGYIVGGNFGSASIDLGDGVILNNKGSSNGMLIKYNIEGQVEWAKAIGGNGSDIINSLAVTLDGGYIVGGSFESDSINLDNETLLNNKGSSDGMLIKYNIEGQIEWAKEIGGSNNDVINSVATTQDGGYIVGGSFRSDNIHLGNGIELHNQMYRSGMVIKYSTEGQIEWAKEIGGDGLDEVNLVVETMDNGIVVVGRTSSKIINLESEIILTGYTNSIIIIKYKPQKGEEKYKVDSTKILKSLGGGNYDSGNIINSITPTKDGGFIIGGYINRGIVLEEGNYLNYGINKGILSKYNEKCKVEWNELYDVRINSVIEKENETIIVGGMFSSKQINLGNENVLNNNGSGNGMIMCFVRYKGVPELEEVIIGNNLKELKITTTVKEINGEKGGVISGDEIIKYGENSTENEIVMTPNEGYEIIGITLNGKEYPFIPNEDGTFIMPRFENMQEDKHIVVAYSLKSNKITINKKDDKTGKALAGTKFKLDQIEERGEPQSVIGNLINNSEIYTENVLINEIGDLTENMIQNGEYYFVKQEDGTYSPTNSKTYQLANGGTAGIHNKTANSYIPIDLNGKTGEYVVVVNARISSEGPDYGCATITSSETAPPYSNSDGRFIYKSGTSSDVTTSKNYVSMKLSGENTYYLHLGYIKDGSVDAGEDRIVINNVKLYECKTVENTYNFACTNGEYVSTNQGKANTTSSSYIEIDLEKCTGKYDLMLDAKISSDSYDYGYTTITKSQTAPKYNDADGRFVCISGTSSDVTTAKEYKTVLDGGYKYYLHLGYYKNNSTDSGDDTFTVSNIRIKLNDSDLKHVEVETNSKGQAITELPYGKYMLIETKSAKGYQELEKSVIIEFREDGNKVIENANTENITVENGEFVIENQKLCKVIVHHYAKDEFENGQPRKLAEDEILEGKLGTEYTTQAKLDLAKYELVKDEKGNCKMPENANGNFEDSELPIEINYYYEKKKVPLTVYHYIVGTVTPVPLAIGGVAEAEHYSGNEGTEYTTNSLISEELDSKYELVEPKENVNGIYEGEEIIVIYYYDLIKKELTINKTNMEGMPLEGVKFDIRLKDEEKTGQLGKIQQNGEYYFEERENKYISNNQRKNSTTASSYIEIDLRNCSNQVLTVNAEISSERNYDKGYAIVTESSDKASINDYYIKLIDYISGSVKAQDYTVELEGGKVYYLHLGYTKDGSGENGTDTFTINNIRLGEGKTREIYTTDRDGKIKVVLPQNDYVVEEIETVEEYQLPENSIHEVTIEDENVELNIENDKIKGTIIVHHYIKDTEIPILIIDEETGEVKMVEEDIRTKYIGEIYVTEAKQNLAGGYKFNSVVGEVSGKYIDGTIEIIYYYEAVVDIDVVKRWNHTNNFYEKPESVTIELYADGKFTGKEAVLTEKNKIEIEAEPETEETWKYTFEGLEKYNADGSEIAYTIEEKKKLIGSLTDNSEIFLEIVKGNEIPNVLGDLTSENNYYFEKQEDGTIIPTNGKTYQEAHGGTGGIQNSISHSYIPIDLREKTSNYAIAINARISSQETDYGFATITQTTDIPEYDNDIGRFMNISGTLNDKDYSYKKLCGGNMYYLHLGYKKDNSIDLDEDQVVINSIKMYEYSISNEVLETLGEVTNNGEYYFEKQEDGTLIPTNGKTYQKIHGGTEGIHETTAHSYVPIDLRNKTGEYIAEINAKVSSEEDCDYGYAMITENIDAPDYDEENNTFIEITGIIDNNNYSSEVLEGGKIYYLHLGYKKDVSVDGEDDQMVINSIKIFNTTSNEITEILGELTKEEKLCFKKQENGTLIPTNGKTYQEVHGGTEGIQDSVAHSYIPINLTGKDGKYVVEVNARISSESNYDYGYAVVNQTTGMPKYDESEKFIDISGTIDNENYISPILEGGKVYYLHLGYTKDGSQDTGEDQIVINDIKVYEAEKIQIKYNFIEENGTYKSTNQGKAETITKSYIPIDLTRYTGKYKLTVNAEVSSEEGADYGYAIVTETTEAPTNGDFIEISGEQEARDYTTELQCGKMYYLHLGYRKDSSVDKGTDTFTINSIDISKMIDEL